MTPSDPVRSRIGGQAAWAGQQIVVKLNLARSLVDVGHGTNRSGKALGGCIRLDDCATIPFQLLLVLHTTYYIVGVLKSQFPIASLLSHLSCRQLNKCLAHLHKQVQNAAVFAFRCHLIRPHPPGTILAQPRVPRITSPMSFQVFHQSSVRADHSSNQ